MFENCELRREDAGEVKWERVKLLGIYQGSDYVVKSNAMIHPEDREEFARRAFEEMDRLGYVDQACSMLPVPVPVAYVIKWDGTVEGVAPERLRFNEVWLDPIEARLNALAAGVQPKIPYKEPELYATPEELKKALERSGKMRKVVRREDD